LPRLIAAGDAELAPTGLAVCLADRELEVRIAVAAALAAIREQRPEVLLDHAVVMDGVRRELAAWHALGGDQASLARAIEHLSTLLALALPVEPVRVAFHGLWSEDAALRGVALEYLDNVLPEDIREGIWVAWALERPAPADRRPVEDVLAELLRLRREERAELIVPPGPMAPRVEATKSP
jgi:hypothetical protein